MHLTYPLQMDGGRGKWRWGGEVFYAKPETKVTSLQSSKQVSQRKRMRCLKQDLNPGQRAVTVLVTTGTDCSATGPQ